MTTLIALSSVTGVLATTGDIVNNGGVAQVQTSETTVVANVTTPFVGGTLSGEWISAIESTTTIIINDSSSGMINGQEFFRFGGKTGWWQTADGGIQTSVVDMWGNPSFSTVTVSDHNPVYTTQAFSVTETSEGVWEDDNGLYTYNQDRIEEFRVQDEFTNIVYDAGTVETSAVTSTILATFETVATQEYVTDQLASIGSGTDGVDGIDGIDGQDGDDFNGNSRLGALESFIDTATGVITANRFNAVSEDGSQTSSFYVDNSGLTHIGTDSFVFDEISHTISTTDNAYDITFDRRIDVFISGQNVGATLADHESRISSLEARVAELEAREVTVIEQITKVYKQDNGDRILVNYDAFTGNMIDVPRKLNFFEFSTPIYSADAVVWHWDAVSGKSVLLKRSDMK